MAPILSKFIERLSEMERWFDIRFGWFFTNGMKGKRHPEENDLRA
jgi:hypothetical protein